MGWNCLASFKFQGDQTFLCDWVEEKFKKEKFEELR